MTEMNVKHIGIKPSNFKASRVGASTGKDFGVAMAGAEGMLGVANTAVGSSNPTAGAVLAAAFGGIDAAAGSFPMMGSGKTDVYGMSSLAGLGTTGLDGTSSSAVIPGTDNFTQADMINTMNQNNLQLLELQATMQSNMQAWNTKSNILNADHRVKTTMIEKLSPR